MTPSDFPNFVLIGGTGSGKSTSADLLHTLGYARLAFAGRADAPHAGSPRDVVTKIWGPEALNDRGKLIAIANAARAVDPDVWLRALETQLDGIAEHTPVVVDDARFENEYWGLKGRGFVSVRVRAPEFSRIDRLKANGKWLNENYLSDPIEHYLDTVNPDYWICNDGTTTDLFNDLVNIIEKERRAR